MDPAPSAPEPTTPSPTPGSTGSTGATGNVSRSGRVRKKSSKLADFESPEDVDKRNYLSRMGGGEGGRRTAKAEQDRGNLGASLQDSDDEDAATAVSKLTREDYEDIPNVEDFDLGDLNEAGEEDDEEEGSLLIDDTRKTKKTPVSGKKTKRRSTTPRLRYPAPLLFCKSMLPREQRQPDSGDLAEVNRRLADRWAALGQVEKDIWRKKARKLNEMGEFARGDQTAAKQPRPAPAAAAAAIPAVTEASSSSSAESTTPPCNYSNSGLFKVVGTDPLDSAAHLKLLGESLTVIGERLTDHDGQIAVSGSLSVLLDSLLCAMGPLMCMTQQVPELNVVPQEKLNRILDNIAYIMPGL